MCPTQHTKHSHLTQEKRVVIEALINQGNTIRAVAMVINVHYSTVSRELSRNSGLSEMGNGEMGIRPLFLEYLCRNSEHNF